MQILKPSSQATSACINNVLSHPPITSQRHVHPQLIRTNELLLPIRVGIVRPYREHCWPLLAGSGKYLRTEQHLLQH